MVIRVGEAIMLSKIFSREWASCYWSQKCGAVLNFPGVMMTHHCTRLCWLGSPGLSNSLCVISIQRSDSVSSPSVGSLLRRVLLLPCQWFSSFRQSPGNRLMNSLWQLIFNGDKIIDPRLCYMSYTLLGWR